MVKLSNYLHGGIAFYFQTDTPLKFDIFKMRAIFKSFWVRKLIGKLGVPYNRGLRVRG